MWIKLWNVENFLKIREKMRLKEDFLRFFRRIFHIINILNVENFFPFLDN